MKRECAKALFNTFKQRNPRLSSHIKDFGEYSGYLSLFRCKDDGQAYMFLYVAGKKVRVTVKVDLPELKIGHCIMYNSDVLICDDWLLAGKFPFFYYCGNINSIEDGANIYNTHMVSIGNVTSMYPTYPEYGIWETKGELGQSETGRCLQSILQSIMSSMRWDVCDIMLKDRENRGIYIAENSVLRRENQIIYQKYLCDNFLFNGTGVCSSYLKKCMCDWVKDNNIVTPRISCRLWRSTDVLGYVEQRAEDNVIAII